MSLNLFLLSGKIDRQTRLMAGWLETHTYTHIYIQKCANTQTHIYVDLSVCLCISLCWVINLSPLIPIKFNPSFQTSFHASTAIHYSLFFLLQQCICMFMHLSLYSSFLSIHLPIHTFFNPFINTCPDPAHPPLSVVSEHI